MKIIEIDHLPPGPIPPDIGESEVLNLPLSSLVQTSIELVRLYPNQNVWVRITSANGLDGHAGRTIEVSTYQPGHLN